MSHEQEEIDDADAPEQLKSPIDHLFDALANFARAGSSRRGGEASRADAGTPKGKFGAVKKSCCVVPAASTAPKK